MGLSIDTYTRLSPVVAGLQQLMLAEESWPWLWVAYISEAIAIINLQLNPDYWAMWSESDDFIPFLTNHIHYSSSLILVLHFLSLPQSFIHFCLYSIIFTLLSLLLASQCCYWILFHILSSCRSWTSPAKRARWRNRWFRTESQTSLTLCLSLSHLCSCTLLRLRQWLILATLLLLIALIWLPLTWVLVKYATAWDTSASGIGILGLVIVLEACVVTLAQAVNVQPVRWLVETLKYMWSWAWYLSSALRLSWFSLLRWWSYENIDTWTILAHISHTDFKSEI